MSWLQPLSKPNSLGRTLSWSLPRGLPSHGGTCPYAGKCTGWCYGAKGHYVFPVVKECYARNLALVKDRSAKGSGFIHELFQEIKKRHKSKPIAAIRIHGTGDFFNQNYLNYWCWIAKQFQADGILFYCYTTSWHLNWTVFDSLPNTNRILSLGARGRRMDLLDYADQHEIATCAVWREHMGDLPKSTDYTIKDGSKDDAVAATAAAGDRIIIKEH